jgi:hypothetical protein
MGQQIQTKQIQIPCDEPQDCGQVLQPLWASVSSSVSKDSVDDRVYLTGLPVEI